MDGNARRLWYVATLIPGLQHFRAHLGSAWSPGRPTALSSVATAADVSKQRSDRWQLDLARPRLHCLPKLQLLAGPRAAAQRLLRSSMWRRAFQNGHSRAAQHIVIARSATGTSAQGSDRSRGESQCMLSSATCTKQSKAEAYSTAKSCEGPLIILPGHTCPACPASTRAGW